MIIPFSVCKSFIVLARNTRFVRVFVNNVSPETAAAKLGGAARKEIAKLVGVE